jgi:hypothetical protein
VDQPTALALGANACLEKPGNLEAMKELVADVEEYAVRECRQEGAEKETGA